MSVSPVQHSNVYVPVQPVPAVPPVKRKDPDGEGAPKAKAATPPHVGTRLDIHA